MNLNTFRNIKEKINEIINIVQDENNLYDENSLIKKYNDLLNQLLSSDLSAIPFDEWKGMVLMADDVLDFSKTHANIDFSLIDYLDYDKIKLQGCNVRNINKIKYDENTFDEKYILENPEFFPAENLPEDIKKDFYHGNIQFSDLVKYPSLRKCITPYSFGQGAYYNGSFILISKIGFDNVMRMFDENPKFISTITSSDFLLSFPNNKKEFSYEEAKKIVYNMAANGFRTYGPLLTILDDIPEDFKQSYPNIFIKRGELPQYIIEKYYSGYLELEDILEYKDILKKKDIEIGIRSIDYYKKINRLFGDVFNFLDKVPKDMAEDIANYLSTLSNEETLQLETKDLDEIVFDTARFFVNNNFDNPLDNIICYCKYLPLSEAIPNHKTREFIINCGPKLLQEFNKKHDYFLDYNFTKNLNSYHLLLGKLAKVADFNNLNIIETEADLRKFLEKTIHSLRVTDSLSLSPISRELSKIFPNEFLDYNMIDKLAADLNPLEKENFINGLERAFNGYRSSLFSVITKNPNVINLFKDKNIILKEDFTDIMEEIGKEKFWDILGNYGINILNLFNLLSYDELSELLKKIKTTDNYEELLNNSIYNNIKDYYSLYLKNLPESFKIKYSNLYLNEDAPEELKKLYYDKKILPSMIQKHPEWIQYLIDKNPNLFCDSHLSRFLSSTSFINDKKIIYDLFTKYGDMLIDCHINLNNCDLKDIDNVIKTQITNSVLNNFTNYDESFKKYIGKECPSLFLDENAPEELKKYFYNIAGDTPLTFELLKNHKEWMPYLKDKNISLSLRKNNHIISSGLDSLFNKYGDEEALKIGLKNPNSLMEMINNNKLDLLFEWYDKLHFVPHHVVMLDFPVNQSDKFLASGKKWSQLMRIDRYNLNEEAKSALLKASMCFGVFDNNDDGFNKLYQLYTGIPKELSESDMTKILDSNNDSLINWNETYVKRNDGKYHLIIDTQKNKKLVNKIREEMENANISKILTPDKSHKLFGGFDMKYDPEFANFIMDNMNTILSSDEYISYIGALQKQWDKIKTLNSNRTLTLDFALAFVKNSNFDNIQIGNNRLAEVSSKAGYDQDSFDKLQQIYNYGKTRTFSSIPRIKNKFGKYSYEVLRLDDPLAVAIGRLTDCCQEIGNAAETCMIHSMVDKNGRIFVIKDSQGNIVAQSWMWRNKNVVCFDNIEIPAKAFTREEKNGIDREQFTDEIFKLYQQAGNELIEKDEEIYIKLLKEKKITKEQFDSLKLGKITVGLGYNDIAEFLNRNSKEDKDIARPLDFNSPFNSNRALYTSDSKSQFILAGDGETTKSTEPTLAIYQDEFEIFDDNNITTQVLFDIQKLERATKPYEQNIRIFDDNNVSRNAYNYNLDVSNTRIIKNANFAIIYDDEKDEIIIGDILYNTKINNDNKDIDITDKVLMQIRMALEQIGIENKRINTSRLNETQLNLFKRAISLNKEIDEERGLSHGNR